MGEAEDDWVDFNDLGADSSESIGDVFRSIPPGLFDGVEWPKRGLCVNQDSNDEPNTADELADFMLSAGGLLEWLDGYEDLLQQRPATTAFESIENMSQLYTVETFRSFVLECAALAHKAKHEAAFTLPEQG